MDRVRESKSSRFKNFYLALHRVIVLVLYGAALWISFKLLSIPAAHADVVTSLSSAAILATLGSAVATVGTLWTGDHANRIALNVDIFFRDILKQTAWRRWPFLLRGGATKLFGGNIQRVELSNPKISLNVGSHAIAIILPTVQDDFFDLPLFRNLVPLLRFRTAARTARVNAEPGTVCVENGLSVMDQYMAYECLTDIWWSVLMFRSARYFVHFGAALSIASAALGGAAALANAT
jgi:hypothetical protein